MSTTTFDTSGKRDIMIPDDNPLGRPTTHGVVQKLLRGRHKPRKVPRLGPMRIMHDPAPPWAAAIIHTLAARLTTETDKGESLIHEVLNWCDCKTLDGRGRVTSESSNPVARAVQVLTLEAHWIGPRAPLLRAFLEAARKYKGGRKAPGFRRGDPVPASVMAWKVLEPEIVE